MNNVIYLEDRIKKKEFDSSFYIQNLFYGISFSQIKKISSNLIRYFPKVELDYKLIFLTNPNDLKLILESDKLTPQINEILQKFSNNGYNLFESSCETLFKISPQTLVIFYEKKNDLNHSQIILNHSQITANRLYFNGRNLNIEEIKTLETINLTNKINTGSNYHNPVIERIFEMDLN